MLRVARCALAITATALVIANCKDSRSVAGPRPTVATVTVGGVPPEGVILLGGAVALSAVAKDASGQPLSDRALTWSSSNLAVATITTHGIVTAISPGGATIRATSEGASDTAALSVRVGFSPPSPGATAPMVQAVLDGRVTLTIPPGAVPAGVAQLTVGPAPSPPASTELVGGTAFDFGPSGTTFAMPLRLTLRFDPGSASAADRAGLAIYHVVGNDYQEMGGSIPSSTTNEVTAPISSFSSYAILRRAAPASVVMRFGDNQATSAGTTVPVRPSVRVLDARGRTVRFVPVTFAVATGGGSLAGAAQVSDSEGVATVGSWTLGAAAGANTLSATVSGLPSVLFTATGRSTAPTRLVVTAQPASTTAGATLSTVVVTALDVSDNTAKTFNGLVTLAFGANPGGATLGGAIKVNAVAGVATFAGLSVNRPGAGYTLTATSTALTGATTSAFDIALGPTTKLAFTQQPAAAGVSASLGTVQVSAEDFAGNVTPTFTGVVHIALGANPGAALLAGPATATAVAGVATFEGLSLNRSATEYTLVASTSGLADATSTPFNIASAPVPQLVLVSGGGQTASTGAMLAQPIVVKAIDPAGNAMAGRTVVFAVTFGGGSVTADSGRTDAQGLASTSWTLGPVLGSQGLSAISTGVGSVVVSATATGTAGPAATLSLSSGGGQSAQAGATLGRPIVVQVSDAAGNAVGGQAVTFAVTTGGGSVTPTSGVSDVLGRVTTSWTLGATEGAQTMTASAGFTPTPLTIAATATGGSPLHLYQDFYVYYYGYQWTYALGVGQSRVVFVGMDQPSSAPVTVTFSHTGTAHTSVPATVTIPPGDNFTSFEISGISLGTDALVATAPGYGSATASTLIDKGTIYLDYPLSRSVKVGDSVTVFLSPFAPDGSGVSLVAPTTFALSSSANVQLVSGGAPSTVLSSITYPAGTATVQFWLKGVATGSGTFTAANANYQTAAGSVTVQPTAGAASTLSLVSGGGQAGAIGAALAQPVVVKVSDAGGNSVAGKTVTFAATSGGGSVTPGSGTSDAQGLVTTSWTLGATVGAQTLAALGAGLTPNPLTVSATAIVAPVNPLHLYSGDYYSYGQFWPAIGIGQYREGAFVWTEGYVGTPLTVTLAHTGSARTSVPSSVTIPEGTNYANFTIAGVSAGTDTLVVTAPGYSPASAITDVDKGRIYFDYTGPLPRVLDSVQVWIGLRAPVDGAWFTGLVAATTFSLTPSANIQVVSGGTASTVLTSITIPADGTSVSVWVKGIAAGTGSLTIAGPNYQPFTGHVVVLP